MGHAKRAALWAMLISIVLTSGCSPFVENNTIEDIAPVIFWSVSEGRDGKLKISTVVPPLVNEKKRLLTMQVDLLKQGGKEFNLIYYRELKNGQTRMLLIHEGLARKGVMTLINTLLTDPDISQRLYLVIVKGNFEEYIQNQLNKHANFDYYLYRMLKHYEKYRQGEMTIVNLHQFMKTLYTPLADPILPVFKVSKNSFSYEGTAFFSHDKLIGSVKEMDDQIIQLVDNDHYLKVLAIPELAVTIGHVRSNARMKFSRDFSSISLQVDLDGRIEEYRGDKKILDEDELADLNKEIKTYLERRTTELLKKMQEWKVDPLQTGTLTLTPFGKPLTKEEWLRYWEKMKFTVDYRIYVEPLTNVKE
ncbi:Ger(x)C family spore germination C-terminal domain-containing protein [Brevibacillus sp. H7]|uniref:Ger(x)C family spore germination protein n=1 Tax=Brevibacillus sp. H7 TaxID=3349138 RepID=UPI0038263E52